MKFGLQDSQYEILEELVIKPLMAKQARIFIFGSRARNSHHPFSDVDILVRESPQSPLSWQDLAKVKDDIENSNLIVKVDLVREQDLVESYRPSVEKDMIEV